MKRIAWRRSADVVGFSSGVHDTKLSLALLVRGVVAALFALLLMSSVRLSLRQVADYFAVYAMADTLITFVTALRSLQAHSAKRTAVLLFEGTVSGAIAVATVIALPATIVLRIFGGVRAVIVGVSDMIWSSRGNSNIGIEIAGVSSIGLGALLLAWPGPGTTAIVWLLGLPALVSGGLMITGAFGQLLQHEEEKTEAIAR